MPRPPPGRQDAQSSEAARWRGRRQTSVDNETAVKNISKMAQEKGCTASVEKVSDAEWHVTVATSGAVAMADPEQDGAAFCDASAGKGKLVISRLH